MSRKISERLESLEYQMEDVPSSDGVWDICSNFLDDFDFSGYLEDTVDQSDFHALEERVNELVDDLTSAVREISGLREAVDELQDRIAMLED